MTTRSEQVAPESHIATLDRVQIELLLTMYGPQVRAMQEDPSKGYFFVENMLAQFFERYGVQPMYEAEQLTRFGLLQMPGENQGIAANSVRISIPILRNWHAVMARAAQIAADPDPAKRRLQAIPARRSKSALSLEFAEVPLPGLVLPAPDPSQISLQLEPGDAPRSAAASGARVPVSTDPTPQTGSPAIPGGISDDEADLPGNIADLAGEFAEQLEGVPKTGRVAGSIKPGEELNSASEVARLLGQPSAPRAAKGKARKGS